MRVPKSMPGAIPESMTATPTAGIVVTRDGAESDCPHTECREEFVWSCCADSASFSRDVDCDE